jgi:hypothetical protein
MNKSRSSGNREGAVFVDGKPASGPGFPSIRHAAIRAWNAASKGGPAAEEIRRGRTGQIRNSIRQDCRSVNRKPAMGCASVTVL